MLATHRIARFSTVAAMAAYKGGAGGPSVPLTARQHLPLTDQRDAVLEIDEAEISIRFIEALGGGDLRASFGPLVT